MEGKGEREGGDGGPRRASHLINLAVSILSCAAVHCVTRGVAKAGASTGCGAGASVRSGSLARSLARCML